MGTCGRLFGHKKIFSNYDHPTIVIVDLPTMVCRKWFFQKFTKWLMGTWGRLFGPEKNFCNYDHPTMVGRKWFFSIVHQMAYGHLRARILVQKNFSDCFFSSYIIPDYSDNWLPDYGESKWFFFKNSPNGLWALGGAYSGPKKFSNYGCPTIVIVDFPTMVSRNDFF